MALMPEDDEAAAERFGEILDWAWDLDEELLELVLAFAKKNPDSSLEDWKTAFRDRRKDN
jgi:hypothetical protein